MTDTTAPESFDFDTLPAATHSEAGAEVPIVHPVTRKPIRATPEAEFRIRVAGPDSAVYRGAQTRAMRRILDRGEAGQEDDAADQSDRAAFLGEITLGWTPGAKLGGQPLEFSRETAAAFYARYPWAADQVDRTAGDRKAFLGA
ncbi:hypothetical protein NON00_13085 [Roseomonas sp. GC11]|uniref:hypothetical protein n=1 Tax=Roseomonas sp. GC11 TaxID=2950546 RepID=UPI00210B5C91|nr:hypothetical protein [Roseomonas sp. GC11]MCQ4160862.1 hypothetical protein [Roseomonas sp. GC11]